MTWGQYLFSFRGRINRLRYWQFLSAAIAVGVGTFLAIGAILSLRIEHDSLWAVAGTIVGILLGFALVCASVVAYNAIIVKRLHDRNKSAWWLIPMVVAPLVLRGIGAVATLSGDSAAAVVGSVFSLVGVGLFIWAFVEIACLRGTDGPNKYGLDPLRTDRDIATVFS